MKKELIKFVYYMIHIVVMLMVVIAVGMVLKFTLNVDYDLFHAIGLWVMLDVIGLKYEVRHGK